MSSTPRDFAILKAVADVVREQVGNAFNAVKERLNLVETRSLLLADEVADLLGIVEQRPEKGEKGDKGDPGTSTAEVVGALMPELKAHVDALMATRPVPRDGIDGKDGTSITLNDIKPLIEAQADRIALDVERRANDVLHRTIERIPQPRDGKDGAPGKDSDSDLVAAKVIERLDLKGTRTDMKRLCGELVTAAVSDIPVPKDGKDGKDAEPITDAQIMAAVEKQLATNPPRDGKDGESVTPEQVAELVRKAVAEIPTPQDGKDGESVTAEQIDAIVEQRVAARVNEFALDFEKRAQATLQNAVDRLPKPKDGVNGFSLEHFDVKSDDGGRTWVLSFDDGQRREERIIVTKMPQYREVWQKDTDYKTGDLVTYSGSTWACLKETQDKPGQFSRAWRLAVKRGRDGGSK